jgi:hypothetical protein
MGCRSPADKHTEAGRKYGYSDIVEAAAEGGLWLMFQILVTDSRTKKQARPRPPK